MNNSNSSYNKQLEEYRTLQELRYKNNPELLEKRRKQEEEDLQLATRLQQEVEAKAVEEGKKREEEDAKLARELQHNLSADDEEEMDFEVIESTAPSSSSQPTSSPNTSQDEELARRMQMEENELNNRLSSNFMYRPFSSLDIRNEDDTSIEPNYENTSGRLNLSPLRNFMPQFRPLIPPEHPLLEHMRQIMELQRIPTGFGEEPRLPARVIVFPDPFLQINGASNLPPHLQGMMRGNVPTDYESLLQLGELLQPVNRGASEEKLSTIPTRTFKAGSIPKEEAKCGICLQDYEDSDELKTLPRCLHHFHTSCIDKWLGINKICPVCREDIEGKT